MKRYVVLLLLALMSVAACKKKQEDVLTSISKHTKKINEDLKVYTLREVEDIVSKGVGRISGYFRDEEAKKVYVQNFGTESRSFTEYYFDDGMLIYVESQEFVYNKPTTYTQTVALESGDSIWYDDSKTRMEINKYYFSDNKLIKWTGPSDTDIPVNIASFTQKEPIIIAKALIALKQLKKE